MTACIRNQCFKGRALRAFAAAGVVIGMALTLTTQTARSAPGDLDPSFGTGGKSTLVIGSFARATAAAFDAQGRITVTGETGMGIERDMALARFSADGQLDPAFAGSAGYVTKDPTPTGQDYIDDLFIQPDGKILIGGTFDGAAGILRYQANGLPDTGFGSGGQVKQDFGYQQRSGGLIPLPNGQIHWYGRSTPDNLDLARFDADGALDTGFGTGGHLQVSAGTATEQYHFGLRLGDGKLLIGGETAGPGPLAGTIVKLNPDGTPDSGFGSGGEAGIGFTGSQLYGLAVDPRGRIITVGVVTGGSGDLAVARLLPSGQPDPSFNGSGRRAIDLGGYETSRAVEIQANGKIVIAGETDASGNDDMFVTRLNPDGTTDTGFGANGTQIVDFAGWKDQANDLLIQPDGSLILVGSAAQPGSSFGLARLEGDPPPAPAPPQTPAPPAGGSPKAKPDRTVRVAILGKRLRVNRRGVTRLRLRCPASETNPPCRGALTLRTARKFKPRPRARGKARRASLGRARYRIAASKTKRVRIKISRAKLRLLRSNRRARRVVAVARTRDGADNRSTSHKRLTIQVKRGHRGAR